MGSGRVREENRLTNSLGNVSLHLLLNCHLQFGLINFPISKAFIDLSLLYSVLQGFRHFF